MKALYSLKLISLLALIAVVSCEKPSLDTHQGNDLSLEEAHKWFDGQVGTLNRARIAESKDRRNRNKTADWSQATNYSTSYGNGIVVPIVYDDFIVPKRRESDDAQAEDKLGKNDTKLDLNMLTYLFLYKDSNGDKHAEVITAIPDAEWADSNMSQYSGLLHVEDWKGNSLYGYQFKNGNVIHRLGGEGYSSKSAKLVPITTDYYYYVVGGGGGATYSYSTTDFIDDGTGDGPTQPTQYQEIVNAGGGGGAGPGPSPPQKLFVRVVEPCLLANLVNMLQSDCVRINDVLNNMFTTNDDFNLRFRNDNLAGDTAGETLIVKDKTDANGIRHLSIQITINTSQRNSSKEHTTATYLHEALHAYLDQCPDKLSALQQHVEMADTYVGWMIQGLQQIYPNLSHSDAAALALEGLSDHPNYNTIIGWYGFTDPDTVDEINLQYSNNSSSGVKKGVYCN